MLSKKLLEARKNKKDEFYTQLTDIENELQYYKEHFKNKTILMNADNPEHSNFWKYFLDNFHDLGVKNIVSTYYNPNGSYKTEFDGKQTKQTELTNGDFRSDEIIDIMKEADIVVTNPPFSLFKDFIRVLSEHNKKFLIIGHQNAMTQKLTFQLMKENKIWLGKGFPGNIGYFINDHYENYAVKKTILSMIITML